VVVAPAQATDGVTLPSGGRGFAPFLAHLVAARTWVPHLRQRRRAEPGVATACYAASANTKPARAFPVFNRSV
jgi:hypothetical protein